MKIEIAKRHQAKIKIGMQGSSGSGKTYSALLLAKGLVNDYSKVVVIDTENKSCSLYSHLGDYNVLNLTSPYTPERYIEAIESCIKAGMEVIIIDTLSMEWINILESHSAMSGNSYTNWAKFTPRHQNLIQTILHADVHIIATLRSKQDYVLNQVNGKYVPEKVGMKAVMRDGMDYELTLVFEIDIKHFSTATKDRTGLFMDKPEFIISEKTGQLILNWCNEGNPVEVDYLTQIFSCNSLMALNELYGSVPENIQQEYLPKFNTRKLQLQPTNHQTNANLNHS